jgi:type IV pilus assembly protein PilC
MPVYQYNAVDKRGKTLRGTMPAQDEANLAEKLKDAGLWLSDVIVHWPRPVAASPRPELRRFRLRGNRGRRELIDFCTLMAFQIRAGVSLVRALDVASTDCKNAGFKELLTDLQNQIESGATFHEAMALYPGIFSEHFLGVLKAGESTSNLPEAFQDLRDYLEWVERVMAEVRQATLYPSIVLTVISCFLVFLFAFIIPKFADLLGKLQVKQPLLTQIVFGLADFVHATWWIWLPLVVLMVLLMLFGRRISPGAALIIDRIKLRLPILGELNSMLALSRFSHNLSILYRSGLPIIQALSMCHKGLIGNVVIELAVAEVEEDVQTGSTISEAMHRQTVFSALLIRMVAMGESSGSLDKALDNVSTYYSEIIPRRIKYFFGILEPALMLFLIFLVGAVALAIYLPIVSLMGAIR